MRALDAGAFDATFAVGASRSDAVPWDSFLSLTSGHGATTCGVITRRARR